MQPATSVKALTFDVFGTVVDWRSSIIREGQLLSESTGLVLDWAEFADAWRAGYQPAMNEVRTGTLPWTNLDQLHSRILQGLVERFGLGALSQSQLAQLNRVWHRLRPWPDSVAGLERLRQRFVIATLSNAHVALLVDLAKHAGLPWDCILSAELSRHYKPDRQAYLTAVDLLGLAPHQVMMVAAHPGDLHAASLAGLKTAFVPRPLEHGPDSEPERLGNVQVDVVAADFLDLAAQLNV
jgi:2-haloacid dehalogenase